MYEDDCEKEILQSDDEPMKKATINEAQAITVASQVVRV